MSDRRHDSGAPRRTNHVDDTGVLGSDGDDRRGRRHRLQEPDISRFDQVGPVGADRRAEEGTFQMYAGDSWTFRVRQHGVTLWFDEFPDETHRLGVTITVRGDQRRTPGTHALLDQQRSDAVPCRTILIARGSPHIDVVDAVHLQIDERRSQDAAVVGDGGQGLHGGDDSSIHLDARGTHVAVG
ncbi:MAG: hypothetical protein EBX95_00505 [Acidimicrobiia bacterium]|nr:hypothetical protein [Acidimicrobiia bacterium]